MPALPSFLKKLVQYRYTIRSFAVRDIKLRYSGSFIGIFWSLVHPLVTVLTYSIIFSFIFKARVGEQYAGSNYSLWLLCGLVPWFFFNETLQRSSTVIMENRNLITKAVFPSEVLPIGLMSSSFVNHVIGMAIVLAAAAILTGGIAPASVYAAVYFVPFALMTLGLAWLLASVNVFIRDVGQMTGIALNLWFFYTPIIYPIGIIPERFRVILELNPVYHIVEGYRRSVLLNEPPRPLVVLSLLAFSLVVFGVGGLVFRRLKPSFPDVL
ncbi:MAG TPA: ABC transporter permease [Nitrospirota bacterium]|nr:ABC transporter permease [Nitrospirota bacterium]